MSHQRVPLHLKHTWPDLKSLYGLLPTVWAMRTKWDLFPSPIVPLPLAPFLSFFQFWLHLPGIICRCLQLQLIFFQMFVHGQTSKTIRMLDQVLDGHQDCCMWPSHSGCDHAYRNESARQVQAGKKGHVTWAAHMSLKVSKDRQHIGSVASTAVILWHWLLDLQLWVSSIREISIEAEAWFQGYCSSPFVASPPWHTLPLSRLVAVSSCLKSPRCSVVQRILAVPQVLAWLWCPRTFVRLINVLSSLSGRICCFDYDASLHDLVPTMYAIFRVKWLFCGVVWLMPGWMRMASGLQQPSAAFSGKHPRRSGSSQNPNRTRNGARRKAKATSSLGSFDSLARGEAWTSSIKFSRNICQRIW